ncbi:MAG: MarR family transcriptional regulator [Candidatus Neomarinimicrobiota bacterium]
MIPVKNQYSFDDDYFQPIVELYLLSLNHYRQFFISTGFNITPQQWSALNRLWQRDGISQAELAKLTFKDDPFTTRLVDVLERKNLVRRVSDKNDRRINRLFLTDEGKAFKEKIYPVYGEMSAMLRNGLTAEELTELKRLCHKLITNYKKNKPK